jgi:hypothetical protein
MNEKHTAKNHEAEDFSETITFKTDEIAIVDAEVVRSLKDKIPLADKVIFVPTKQSKDVDVTFKIVAEYNDASIKRLVMEPASAGEETCDHGDPVEEGVQPLGKGGDPVERKTAKHRRVAGGARPKTAHRDKRNERYSKSGDPGSNLTDNGKSSVEQRVDQRMQVKGAERENFGQPRHKTRPTKVEVECMEFIERVKTNTISEEYLGSMGHIYEIRTALADIRDNARVKGKSFDLVYESINILDNYQRDKAKYWIENIVMKGGFGV